MLLSGFNSPSSAKRAVSRARRSTGSPRSSTMGRRPARASASAAKSPPGPRPATTGRGPRGGGAMRGGAAGAGTGLAVPGFKACRHVASFFSATSTVITKCTSPLSRASTLFLAIRQESACSGLIRSFFSAARSGASGPASRGIFKLAIRSMGRRFLSDDLLQCRPSS